MLRVALPSARRTPTSAIVQHYCHLFETDPCSLQPVRILLRKFLPSLPPTRRLPRNKNVHSLARPSPPRTWQFAGAMSVLALHFGSFTLGLRLGPLQLGASHRPLLLRASSASPPPAAGAAPRASRRPRPWPWPPLRRAIWGAVCFEWIPRRSRPSSWQAGADHKPGRMWCMQVATLKNY